MFDYHRVHDYNDIHYSCIQRIKSLNTGCSLLIYEFAILIFLKLAIITLLLKIAYYLLRVNLASLKVFLLFLYNLHF